MRGAFLRMVQTSGFSLEAFESEVAMIAPYPPNT